MSWLGQFEIFGASTPSRLMRNLSAATDEAARHSRCELSSSAGLASGIVVSVAVPRTIDSDIISAEADVTVTRYSLRAFVSTALQRNARMSVMDGLPRDRRKHALAAVDSGPADATK